MHNADRANGSIFPIAALSCALLAACGGGGGSSGSPGIPTPQTSTTPTPPTTTAKGTLVDDATNAPMAGISVKLEPWIGGATPLPSPQATTAADGTFSLGGVPNGHYLLVIGSDSPSDTTRPTIHDNVTLAGGMQTLHAPTLPPVPNVTPSAAETNGSYRLTAIDQTNELPCLTSFNQSRVSHALPQVAADEWLIENARAVNTYEASTGTTPASPAPWPGNSYGELTTGNAAVVGGTACSDMTTYAFNGSNSYATDARTEWFGAAYLPYVPAASTSARGTSEFPIDPRAFTDPNVPVWP